MLEANGTVIDWAAIIIEKVLWVFEVPQSYGTFNFGWCHSDNRHCFSINDEVEAFLAGYLRLTELLSVINLSDFCLHSISDRLNFGGNTLKLSLEWLYYGFYFSSLLLKLSHLNFLKWVHFFFPLLFLTQLSYLSCFLKLFFCSNTDGIEVSIEMNELRRMKAFAYRLLSYLRIVAV